MSEQIFARTRAEAISRGDKHYHTGKQCPKGHTAPRFVSNFGCAECLRLQSQQYARRDPEGNRRRSREWAEANPEKAAVIAINTKAKARGATDKITVEEWVDLCVKHDGRCVRCGSADRVGADHVVPLSKGGANTIDNIQPLCFPCNQSKWRRTIDYRDGVS